MRIDNELRMCHFVAFMFKATEEKYKKLLTHLLYLTKKSDKISNFVIESFTHYS